MAYTHAIGPAWARQRTNAGRNDLNYSLQMDAFGNMIVCKGDAERNGYRVAMRGTYAACCCQRDYFARMPRAQRLAAAGERRYVAATAAERDWADAVDQHFARMTRQLPATW